MQRESKVIKSNQVSIVGKIETDFRFSHEAFGEGFYVSEISAKRLSDSEDRIPVMVSERLIDVNRDYVEEYIQVRGQFRSCNKHEGGKSHLILSVFAREISFVEDEDSMPENYIYLDGRICKPPIYRNTPLGREIADIILAVNRPYKKSDYLPTIFWGRNARFVSGLEVGTRLKVWGRIQSWEYQKKIADDKFEIRTAFEVSANRLEVAKESGE